MFAKKEFDYSHKSMIEHNQMVREMERFEKRGTHRTIKQIADEKHASACRIGAHLLYVALESKTRDERHANWDNFKGFVIRYNLKLPLKCFKTAIKKWRTSKIVKKAA